ncbi:MAG: tail fiber domain-containing protein [Thermodesulfobacteriota bacterium]|nr:tail fiber domain-containing protein [Thermodesulfobacteriota bacterium]
MMTDENGNVGIGTTNPESPLHIESNNNRLLRLDFHPSSSSYTWQFFEQGGGELWRIIGRNTNHNLEFVDNSGNSVLELSQGGNVHVDNILTAGSCCQSSDIRLKTNITTCDNALDKVSQLRGVTFNWKDEDKDPGTQLGVIAQEVEKVFPEVVETDSQDGYKSVAYSKLVAPLIEAVKELKAENDDLKKEIAQIKEKLAANNDILR